MAREPITNNLPRVKTHLKYTVSVLVPDDVFDNPPKARDVLNIRVNAVQEDVINNTKKNIGKVLLAANRLAHPSNYRIVHEEVEDHEPGSIVPKGYKEIEWTYVMKGAGVGEFADENTTSENVWKMYEVLINGNGTPIKTASKIREFDSGPLEVRRIQIHT